MELRTAQGGSRGRREKEEGGEGGRRKEEGGRRKEESAIKTKNPNQRFGKK